jgi:hypothetical protein
MGNLIPDQALIYERSNGIVYARYRDPPYNKLERWIIGGDADKVAEVSDNLFTHRDWYEILRLSNSNPTLKKQLDQLLTTYYILKDDK